MDPFSHFVPAGRWEAGLSEAGKRAFEKRAPSCFPSFSRVCEIILEMQNDEAYYDQFCAKYLVFFKYFGFL